MHDARNVAPIERCLSFGAGVLLGSAAAYLLYRSVTGYCALYAALGIQTSPAKGAHNANASVPYGTGIRIEETVPQRFKSIAERGEICAS